MGPHHNLHRRARRTSLSVVAMCASITLFTAACGASSGDGDTSTEVVDSEALDSGAAATPSTPVDVETDEQIVEPSTGDAEPGYEIAEPTSVIPIDDAANGSRKLSFALSPTGDRLAVLQADSDAIEGITYTYTIFDTATAAVVSSMPAEVGLSSLAWTSPGSLTGFGPDGFHIRDAESFESQSIVQPLSGCVDQLGDAVFDDQSNSYYRVSGSSGCRLDAATGAAVVWDFEQQVADVVGGGGSIDRAAVQPGGGQVVTLYRSADDGTQLVTLDGATMQEISRIPFPDDGAVELVGSASTLIETFQNGRQGLALEGQPDSFLRATQGVWSSPAGGYFSTLIELDPTTGAVSFQGEPARLIIDAATGEAVVAVIPGGPGRANAVGSTWSADDSTYAVVGDSGISVVALSE